MTAAAAITFDLWDTLVVDDSDEVKRNQQGLLSKRDERRRLLYNAISSVEPIEQSDVRLAFDVADAAFNRVWRHHHVTWRIEERIDVILQALQRQLPAPVRAELIEQLEVMEVDIPPVLVEGCVNALEELSAQCPLAIVSDAIVTPGRQLRNLLENHGIKKYFSAFAFSDEIGYSKPHRAMFAAVAEELSVPIEQMIHIGDREHNDVGGAHSLGMRAILFTAARDADSLGSKADAVCRSYAELPDIISQLANVAPRSGSGS